MNDAAVLFLQMSLGLFFTITGFRKVFVKDTRDKVFALFRKYDVSAEKGWAVVLGEFFGGLSLLTGILASIAAPLLLPIMAGAIYLSVMPTLRRAWKAQGASLSSKVSNFLCTAEVQMTLSLIALTIHYWS